MQVSRLTKLTASDLLAMSYIYPSDTCDRVGACGAYSKGANDCQLSAVGYTDEVAGSQLSGAASAPSFYGFEWEFVQVFLLPHGGSAVFMDPST